MTNFINIIILFNFLFFTQTKNITRNIINIRENEIKGNVFNKETVIAIEESIKNDNMEDLKKL